MQAQQIQAQVLETELELLPQRTMGHQHQAEPWLQLQSCIHPRVLLPTIINLILQLSLQTQKAKEKEIHFRSMQTTRRIFLQFLHLFIQLYWEEDLYHLNYLEEDYTSWNSKLQTFRIAFPSYRLWSPILPNQMELAFQRWRNQWISSQLEEVLICSMNSSKRSWTSWFKRKMKWNA